MYLANFLNNLIKKDGFVLIDANSTKYVIGQPKKENPITIKLLDKKGEKIKTQHILLSLPVLDEDLGLSYSFLDSLQKSTTNDPGLFDSLAVAVGDGFSGAYNNAPIEDFPLFVGDFLKKGGDFSFSDIIKNDGFFNVVFKYSFSPSEQKNLENSWFEIEALAINKKRFDLFDLWISEKKENMYIFVKDF